MVPTRKSRKFPGLVIPLQLERAASPQLIPRREPPHTSPTAPTACPTPRIPPCLRSSSILLSPEPGTRASRAPSCACSSSAPPRGRSSQALSCFSAGPVKLSVVPAGPVQLRAARAPPGVCAARAPPRVCVSRAPPRRCGSRAPSSAGPSPASSSDCSVQLGRGE